METPASKSFDIKSILSFLPHRYPFLLVDRVLEVRAGEYVKALKNVTINEPFFNGHFPGEPIMPGVLQVEALAQTTGLAMNFLPENQGKIAFFAAVDEVKFKKPVIPGDQLILEVEILLARRGIIKANAKASVDGQVTCTAVITLAVPPGLESNKTKLVNENIDPTAQVHPSVKLGKNTKVGPYTVINENVVIGDDNDIHSHVVIYANTEIGHKNQIHSGTVIGDAPQDLKFGNEFSGVKIGDENQIREYVTINRATGENKFTIVGNKNLLCSHVHLAHNCEIGNEVVIVSLCQLAGHVVIEDKVIMGGMVGVPQFVRVGKMAMIGGYSRLYQDIPPYMMTAGNPTAVVGVNLIGLRRNKISTTVIDQVRKAYKLIYRSDLNITSAVEQIKTECLRNLENGEEIPEIKGLLEFIEKTNKGINRKPTDEEMGEMTYAGLVDDVGFFNKLKEILIKK
jgi:UDP-N-acetylglucosamine acyltransferase